MIDLDQIAATLNTLPAVLATLLAPTDPSRLAPLAEALSVS